MNDMEKMLIEIAWFAAKEYGHIETCGFDNRHGRVKDRDINIDDYKSELSRASIGRNEEGNLVFEADCWTEDTFYVGQTRATRHSPPDPIEETCDVEMWLRMELINGEPHAEIRCMVS